MADNGVEVVGEFGTHELMVKISNKVSRCVTNATDEIFDDG